MKHSHGPFEDCIFYKYTTFSHEELRKELNYSRFYPALLPSI